MSKKAQEAEAYAEVKKLFLSTNRPYSLQLVVNALGSKFGKTVVNKALDKLTEEGTLEAVDAGKSSKLWTPNQQLFSVLSPDELAEKKMTLTTVESQLAEAKAKLAVLNRTLITLTSHPTTPDLANDVAELKKVRDEKAAALEETGPTVTESEYNALKTKLAQVLKVWKARRMNVRDVIDQMSEGMEKKPKELMETIGLESDGTEQGQTTAELDKLTK